MIAPRGIVTLAISRITRSRMLLGISWRAKDTHAASKLASANGRAVASASRNVTFGNRFFRRAIRSIAPDRSIPTTSRALSANANACAPVPVATSRTLESGLRGTILATSCRRRRSGKATAS